MHYIGAISGNLRIAFRPIIYKSPLTRPKKSALSFDLAPLLQSTLLHAWCSLHLKCGNLLTIPINKSKKAVLKLIISILYYADDGVVIPLTH